MCSLSVKVLSNYLHLQAHCDKLKAFRIAQFFQNSKIQKITVKKIFFQNFDTGFLLIGVFRVYSRSFIAKLAKTKKSISSEINPTHMIKLIQITNLQLKRQNIDIYKIFKFRKFLKSGLV